MLQKPPPPLTKRREGGDARVRTKNGIIESVTYTLNILRAKREGVCAKLGREVMKNECSVEKPAPSEESFFQNKEKN